MNYPTTQEATTRIEKAFRQAVKCEDCDVAKTRKWYSKKSAWIRRHKRADWTMDQATAIYAVMSTNSTVPENDQHFLNYVESGTFRHFGDVVRRANLANYGRIDLALEYKNGEKVRSFAANLRYPRRAKAVTIDRHAADIATQSRKNSKNMLAWSNRRGYFELAAAYVTVAKTVDMLPNELQAVVWVHHVDCNGGLSALPNTTKG